jgi:hypothetical protein
MPPKYPEFVKLSDLLKNLEIPETTEIRFFEESDRGNLYEITVGCQDTTLLRKLAEFWGAGQGTTTFAENQLTASDSWHGRGQGNLRKLADEIGIFDSPFFDMTMDVQEIHEIAETPGTQQASEEQKQESKALGILKRLREALSDHKGHGMPGFTDRALAILLMEECDTFLREPQEPNANPVLDWQNLRIQTTHTGQRQKIWEIPGNRFDILTHTGESLAEITVNRNGSLQIKAGAPCPVENRILMDSFQIKPISANRILLSREPLASNS